MLSKPLKKASVFCAISALALCMAGCQSQQTTQSTQKGYPIQWTENVDGQNIQEHVNAAPKRALSMSQATSEMLLTLGLQKEMVGTAFQEEEVYPPVAQAYSQVKVVAQKWPSLEAIVAEKPDFITGWGVAFTKRGIPAQQLEAQHIPIWIPNAMQDTNATLDTLFQDMEELGKIFNVSDRATAWVQEQKAQLDKVKASVAALPKVRVFIFDAEDEKPFTVFNGYTTNVLALIGAENVMADPSIDKTWGTTSWENVVAADPDYILICDYSNSMRNDDDFQKKVAAFKNNPQLAHLKAVRENRFVKVKLSEITPGVRTVQALTRIAEQIHGLKLN